MKWYYWKADQVHLSATLLLLFSLFASISFTPSEYLECRSLFPDENLEIFSISKISNEQFPSQHVTTLIAASTIPQYSWTSPLFLEAFSRQRTKTQKVLPTFLRC